MPSPLRVSTPVLLLLVLGAAAPASAQDASGRALATVDAMLGYDAGAGGFFGQLGDRAQGVFFGSQHRPAYREWAGETMEPATAWPLSQLLAAELDQAMLTGDPRRAVGVIDELRHHLVDGAYAPHPRSHGGGGQVRYYDDNAWIGLDLVQAYRVTRQREYLDQAAALVPFLEAGAAPGGGLLWRERDPSPSLNTCANAPAMQLYLALYAETRDPRYLEAARALEPVLNGALRRPDGLYRDNVRVEDPSRTDETLWSYNQGAALGANLQLAAVCDSEPEATRLLDLAEETAAASLRLLEQDPDWLWSQPPGFDAVFFRNLLKLDLVRPDPRYRAALRGYLERADREARRAENGAYELGGIGRYDHEVATGITLLDQAGMAQMLALDQLSAAALALVA